MIESLEVAWSGALEAAGIAPGLSSYQGRSSLYHSPPWPMLVQGEVKGNEPIKKHRHGGRRFGEPPLTEHQRIKVHRLLFEQYSLRKTAVIVGVHVNVVRRYQDALRKSA
jgi:hypothetical protein